MSISNLTQNSFSLYTTEKTQHLRMDDRSLARDLQAVPNNDQSLLEKIANISSLWNRTSKDEHSNTTEANAFARLKKIIFFIPSKIATTSLQPGWIRTALSLGFLAGLILVSAKEEDLEFVQGAPSEESRLCQSDHFNCVEGHIRKSGEVVSQFIRFIIKTEIGNSDIWNIRAAKDMSQCFTYQMLEAIVKRVVDITSFLPINSYHSVIDIDPQDNFAFSASITSVGNSTGNIIMRLFSAAHELCLLQYESQSNYLQPFST